jgi:hypothetical protein
MAPAIKIDGDALRVTYWGDAWAGLALGLWMILNFAVMWQLATWVGEGGSLLIAMVGFAIMGVGLWMAYAMTRSSAIIQLHCDRARNRIFVRRTGFGWMDHFDGRLGDIEKISIWSPDVREYWLMVEVSGGTEFPVVYARTESKALAAAVRLKSFLGDAIPETKYQLEVT